MAQVFKASINLARVTKEQIFVNEKGEKYLTLRLVFNKETPDQYGSVGFVAQQMPREAADALEHKGILGNIKVTEQSQPKTAAEDDDLGF